MNRSRVAPLCDLLAAALLALPVALPGGVFDFKVREDVPADQRLFIGSELAEMGAGDALKSVAMYECGDDLWCISFDLPDGSEFTPSLYLRPRDWKLFSDQDSVELVRQLDPISAESTAHSRTLSLHIDGECESLTVTVSGEKPTVTPSEDSTEGGWQTFQIQLPLGTDSMAVACDERQLFADALIHPDAEELWISDGEAYRYRPAATHERPRFESFTFAPGAFLSRPVTVMLPRNYDLNIKKTYPVLYAMDGQNVFVPGGPFGTWAIDTAAEALTNRGDIPEIIIVAVGNTSDRIPEYAPEFITRNNARGRAGEFLTMLRDELKPYIDERYRTKSEAESTGFIGSSMGGLIGFYAAHEFRDTFGNVAALSSAFWLAPDEFEKLAERSPKRRARVWLDSGHTGRSADDATNTLMIRDTMLRSGESLGPHFTHTIGLNHQHNESAWSERVPDILRWMF